MGEFKFRHISFIGAFLMLGILFLGNGSFSQIQKGGNEPEPKKEKEKKEKKERTKKSWDEDSLSGVNYYFEGMGMWTYRTFSDESVYGQYADRVNETGSYRGGMRLGLIQPLNDYVSLDIGVSYFGNGEKYAFNDSISDSTYSYTRRYLQLGVPLRIRFTSGKKLQGFMYTGVTPINILQIRLDADYTTQEGSFIDLPEQKIKNDFSSFNVLWTIGAGARYNFKYFGISYSAEYRRHLMNTYDTNELNVRHHMFGIGMNLGIYVRL